MINKVSFHVDLDSPLKLLKFYGLEINDYTTEQLDRFYFTAMTRVLNFFYENHIHATFFIVGDDLNRSTEFQKMIRKAHADGHEMGNHTYSHPFGLSKLDKHEIVDEIKKCNDIIKAITNIQPLGFRSPGYDISSEVINILEQNGYLYDSSGFWSILNPVIKLFHKINSKDKNVHSGFGENSFILPNYPYFPNSANWLKKETFRKFVEIPLPTNKFKIPYYSNFHLMYPDYFMKKIFIKSTRTYFVYLFHIIEFMDMSDDIPEKLRIHPNLTVPLDIKIKKLKTIVNTILESHQCILSGDFAKEKIDKANNGN